MRAGRPRKPNVNRDRSGKSRGEKEVVHPESLAVRQRALELDGVKGDPMDALAGFTLGKLLLRTRACSSDPGGISEEQYNTGEEWARIVRREAVMMGFPPGIKSNGFVMVARGLDCAPEPNEEEIIKIRRKFSDCYNALMAVCRDHGIRVRDVVYGVCVENWPVHYLSEGDYGRLRLALNAIGRVI